MDAIFGAVCGTGGLCDAAGVWLGALLTLAVWSYLIRDTLLFQLAANLLVGTAVGYTSAVVLRTVVWDRLLGPLALDTLNLWANQWLLFIPLLLGLLLMLKLVPSWSSSTLSNLGLAYLFGVGAALAIAGALGGALLPQVSATIVSLTPGGGVTGTLNSLVMVIGVLGALLAFRFVTQNNSPLLRSYQAAASAWGQVGRAFIMVAFGSIFAGVLLARVSALVGQLYFLFHDWLGWVR